MFKLISTVAMCAALALTLSATDVDAKKFGGGKSVGAQRSSVSDAKSGAPSASPTSAPANAAVGRPVGDHRGRGQRSNQSGAPRECTDCCHEGETLRV